MLAEPEVLPRKPSSVHEFSISLEILLQSLQACRQATERLCAPLATEDYVVQSMPEASPIKWHLAHTTWFFETFVVAPFLGDAALFDPRFRDLFNSYYNSIGSPFPRRLRGALSRPTVDEVFAYRSFVDQRLEQLLRVGNGSLFEKIAPLIRLGIQHEQQHQELIVADLKNAFHLNPLEPVYCAGRLDVEDPPEFNWQPFAGGVQSIGHNGPEFAFDNESPRHLVLLRPYQLASRLVNNGEYLQFMEEGGYQRPEFWLSDGWATKEACGWASPLYWEKREGQWTERRLAGVRPLNFEAPVCHVSYYEAEAFAAWAGARLPTEAEWETAAATHPIAGHFLESGHFHPAEAPARDDLGPLYQLFGDVWQWTSSPYVAFPGYKASVGALGEYNGKFMCNQLVLRGASCATPKSHARLTYRNFFPAETRWQFSGIRLAKELS